MVSMHGSERLAKSCGEAIQGNQRTGEWHVFFFERFGYVRCVATCVALPDRSCSDPLLAVVLNLQRIC